MKNTETIRDKIKLDEFLNSSNSFTKFKEYYENFNKVKTVLSGRVYCKYKINADFIDNIFYSLHYESVNEETFKDIESKLIIFRDLLFYFQCFINNEKSIFNFITPATLNFKYITEDNLKVLKSALSNFKFYLMGIKRVNFSYAGLYCSITGTCLYTFHDMKLDINIDEKTNKPVLVGLNGENNNNKKSNLILFEKAFRCKFKDCPLVITDGKFDEDFFIYYKDLISD